MNDLAALYAACRFVHFAAIIQLFGLLLFSEYLAPAGLRCSLRLVFHRAVLLLAWATMVTSLLMLCLQAGQMGDGWSDTLRPPIWLAVMRTAFGQIWLWHSALALTAVAAAYLLTTPGVRNRSQLMAVGCLLLTLGLVGHAAINSGLPGIIQRINHMVHLLSAAWWVGGLLPLAYCMRLLGGAERPLAMQTLVRYSQSGHVAVALVILTGIINNAFILGQWPTIGSSWYQSLLIAKTLLVLLMLVLAITNRYLLVPAMGRDETRALRLLIRFTVGEIGLASLVLLLVSIFAMLEPV